MREALTRLRVFGVGRQHTARHVSFSSLIRPFHADHLNIRRDFDARYQLGSTVSATYEEGAMEQEVANMSPQLHDNRYIALHVIVDPTASLLWSESGKGVILPSSARLDPKDQEALDELEKACEVRRNMSTGKRGL